MAVRTEVITILLTEFQERKKMNTFFYV